MSAVRVILAELRPTRRVLLGAVTVEPSGDLALALVPFVRGGAGAEGAPGAPGAAGPAGPKGDKGDPGDDAVNIDGGAPSDTLPVFVIDGGMP